MPYSCWNATATYFDYYIFNGECIIFCWYCLYLHILEIRIFLLSHINVVCNHFTAWSAILIIMTSNPTLISTLQAHFVIYKLYHLWRQKWVVLWWKFSLNFILELWKFMLKTDFDTFSIENGTILLTHNFYEHIASYTMKQFPFLVRFATNHNTWCHMLTLYTQE